MNNVVAALFTHSQRGGIGMRICKHVNYVLTVFIDQGSDGLTVHIIETPADQREAFFAEIYDLGREVEFSVEPGLDRVLVGGSDIRQMIHQKGTDMVIQYLVLGY